MPTRGLIVPDWRSGPGGSVLGICALVLGIRAFIKGDI
jgi:hypothetical protein